MSIARRQRPRPAPGGGRWSATGLVDQGGCVPKVEASHAIWGTAKGEGMKDIIGLAVLAWPVTLLGVIALAFVVAIAIALYLARHRKGGWKWWAWAAVLVYLVVFWDHIPTVLAHKYYCENEAGFWIYETVDQWKSENPGVMETLKPTQDAPSRFEGDMQNSMTTFILNSRFSWVVKKNGPLFLHRWRREYELVDIGTHKTLARYVDFSTGDGNIGGAEVPIKFWLQSWHCSDGEYNESHFRQFRDNLIGTTK